MILLLQSYDTSFGCKRVPKMGISEPQRGEKTISFSAMQNAVVSSSRNTELKSLLTAFENKVHRSLFSIHELCGPHQSNEAATMHRVKKHDPDS